MNYKVPTLAEATSFLRALWRGLFPDRNLGSTRSYHYRRVQIIAAAQTEIHAHVDSAVSDVMPDSATGAAATRWGELVGTVRKGATGARKSDALLVRGTAATAINSGEELVHQSSGLRFQIAEDEVVPVSGEIAVDIAAIDTGAATRLLAGQVLEFVSTPAGLETQAELQIDVDEDGDDSEQDPAYKTRYLATMKEPTAGGTQADYVAWALQVTGVAAAFAYPNRAGLGTVDLVGLHAGTGSARELNAGERDDLLAYVAAKAPAQMSGGALRVLVVTLETEDVEITIETNGDAAYAFDWVDDVPPEVLTVDAPNRTIQFAADRPSTMKAGDRIVIKGVSSDSDGDVLIIEALGGADDEIILQEWPPVDPDASDLVYAGGPLTATIRDAIVAHMNGGIVYAGPDGPLTEATVGSMVNVRVLADGIGSANPAGIYGAWSGGLIVSILEKLATYTRGVRDATVITPASNQEASDPAFPNDDEIGLIAPGKILVRGA